MFPIVKDALSLKNKLSAQKDGDKAKALRRKLEALLATMTVKALRQYEAAQ